MDHIGNAITKLIKDNGQNNSVLGRELDVSATTIKELQKKEDVNTKWLKSLSVHYKVGISYFFPNSWGDTQTNNASGVIIKEMSDKIISLQDEIIELQKRLMECNKRKDVE